MKNLKKFAALLLVGAMALLMLSLSQRGRSGERFSHRRVRRRPLGRPRVRVERSRRRAPAAGYGAGSKR